MAIEKLSQFELEMYQEALQAKSADGKRAYFSFGDYLESQARAYKYLIAAGYILPPLFAGTAR